MKNTEPKAETSTPDTQPSTPSLKVTTRIKCGRGRGGPLYEIQK